jgi:hypothetical protein
MFVGGGVTKGGGVPPREVDPKAGHVQAVQAGDTGGLGNRHENSGYAAVLTLRLHVACKFLTSRGIVPLQWFGLVSADQLVWGGL